MNTQVYEFMKLYNGSRALVNVIAYKRHYSDESKKTTEVEVYEGKYLDMPSQMRYDTIRKWDIEMRDYKVYFVMYI